MKICSKCKHTYANPVESFSRLKRAPDGLQYRCKQCANDARRKQHQNQTPEQREANRLRSRQYYYDHLESERARSLARRMKIYHQRKRDKARWLVTLFRLKQSEG